MYYTEFISKNKCNPNKMWEIINSAISTKSVISTLTKINMENSVIEDSSKIADCFNEFFVEIGHSIVNNVNKTPTYRLHYLLKKPSFTFFRSRSPTAIEIFHLINSINPNKASGVDNINPFFLRIGAAVLASILSIYFQS